jgi:hypothetical protein
MAKHSSSDHTRLIGMIFLVPCSSHQPIIPLHLRQRSSILDSLTMNSIKSETYNKDNYTVKIKTWKFEAVLPIEQLYFSSINDTRRFKQVLFMATVIIESPSLIKRCAVMDATRFTVIECGDSN